MKTKAFLFILLQLFIANSFAQENSCNCDSTSNPERNYEVRLMGKAFINKYPGKRMQFYKSWLPGELLMSNGMIVKNKFLGYNSLLDELIWMRTTDYQQVILNKKIIAGFSLYDTKNQKIAEFRKFQVKNWLTGDSAYNYLQVLVEGKISLYVQRKVVVLSSINEFQDQDQYYLLKEGRLYSLVPNRWFLFRIMGNDKTKMKTIVRKNFLLIKNEPALIKAVQLFNEEYN